MKTTKYNGITYQLDESKFKPAYIKFDQDMFDDEIYPVLFGLGFEVEIQGSRYFLVNNYNYVNLRFSRSHYSYNRFECYTAKQFLEASGIFAVADELPKDWYIEVTEENLEELDTWRKSVASECANHRLKVGYFIMSKHYRDESYYYGSVYEHYLLADHKKINLETFRKITNMKPAFSIKGTKLPSIPKGTFYRTCNWLTSENDKDNINHYDKNFVSYGLKEFRGETYVLAETNDYQGINYWMFKLSDIERLWKEQNQKQDIKKSFTINAKQAQSIIDIACSAWKKQLAEKWANNIVLNKETEISEEFYKEMRAACTAPQNELFDKIFGKEDDDSVDLSKIDNSLLRSASKSMLEVRDSDEYKNKAFYLSDDFNWEIKSDPIGVVCLIPTKKC